MDTDAVVEAHGGDGTTGFGGKLRIQLVAVPSAAPEPGAAGLEQQTAVPTAKVEHDIANASASEPQEAPRDVRR